MDLDSKRPSRFESIISQYSSDSMINRELQRLYSAMTEDEYVAFIKILESLEYFVIIPNAYRKISFNDVKKKIPNITSIRFNKIIRNYGMLFKSLGFSIDTMYNTITISFLDPRFK